MLDVNALIGSYPYRHVSHPDVDALVRVMDREGIDRAWVGHLPSAFYREPSQGTADLLKAIAPLRQRLDPVPAVHPVWPDWRDQLRRACDEGAPAVRAYPPQWGLGPDDPSMVQLAASAAAADVVLLLTVRFEDQRQRHIHDGAGDLPPAMVRAIARAGTGVRLVIAAAGRDFIEQVHWSLTPLERASVWWDISWIWGPPEDHLAHLFETMGADRFVFGTHWPLRLAQVPRANLSLLPPALSDVQLAQPSTWRAE